MYFTNTHMRTMLYKDHIKRKRKRKIRGLLGVDNSKKNDCNKFPYCSSKHVLVDFQLGPTYFAFSSICEHEEEEFETHG